MKPMLRRSLLAILSSAIFARPLASAYSRLLPIFHGPPTCTVSLDAAFRGIARLYINGSPSNPIFGNGQRHTYTFYFYGPQPASFTIRVNSRYPFNLYATKFQKPHQDIHK